MTAKMTAQGLPKGFMHGQILVMRDDTARAFNRARRKGTLSIAAAWPFMIYDLINAFDHYALGPWWTCPAALLVFITLNIAGLTMWAKARKRYIA